MNVTVHY